MNGLWKEVKISDQFPIGFQKQSPCHCKTMRSRFNVSKMSVYIHIIKTRVKGIIKISQTKRIYAWTMFKQTILCCMHFKRAREHHKCVFISRIQDSDTKSIVRALKLHELSLFMIMVISTTTSSSKYPNVRTFASKYHSVKTFACFVMDWIRPWHQICPNYHADVSSRNTEVRG